MYIEVIPFYIFRALSLTVIDFELKMAEFADAPTVEEVPEDVAAMFDLTVKKKKKKSDGTSKKKDKTASAETAPQDENVTPNQSEGSSSGVFELDPPIYTYEQLLNRVVDFVHQNNPELTDKKRFTMKPPQLMRGMF